MNNSFMTAGMKIENIIEERKSGLDNIANLLSKAIVERVTDEVNINTVIKDSKSILKDLDTEETNEVLYKVIGNLAKQLTVRDSSYRTRDTSDDINPEDFFGRKRTRRR